MPEILFLNASGEMGTIVVLTTLAATPPETRTFRGLGMKQHGDCSPDGLIPSSLSRLNYRPVHLDSDGRSLPPIGVIREVHTQPCM